MSTASRPSPLPGRPAARPPGRPAARPEAVRAALAQVAPPPLADFDRDARPAREEAGGAEAARDPGPWPAPTPRPVARRRVRGRWENGHAPTPGE
ncbi:hypothetical protein [Streptomyces sp. CC208A]|uniref:hypothetical protein n=1 Tax=Streptomyces sp. CC208A TaxID=3044573 RepID=UPI0024A7E4F3|nr:hypothetical protein [Streptomyces sp. CC208A]